MLALRREHLIELGAAAADVDRYLADLNEQLNRHDIGLPLRAPHFLAQVFHESGRLRQVEENLNYSAEGLCAVFGKYYPDVAAAAAYARNPERIACRVYGGRMGNGDEASGDGWTYRGRGLIQLTGRDNYRDFSAFIGSDCVGRPDLVRERFAVHSAVYYWVRRGLNALADADDIEAITRRINGGLNGFDERVLLLTRAKALLAAEAVPPPVTQHTHTVAAAALNLRTRPEVSARTLVATLPQGTPVEYLDRASQPGWAHVRLLQNGKVMTGVLAERYLTPLAVAPASVPVDLDAASGERAPPAVHLMLERRDVTRARDGGRAFPLGETGRPARDAVAPAERAAQLLRIIRYLDPEHPGHLRWKATGSTTYCNIYAYDYACLAGVYLPRVWWTEPALAACRRGEIVEAEYGRTVRELNANALHDWFQDHGRSFGWQREADPGVLQAAANNGEVCIIVARRRDTNRPGHIAAVAPEHDDHRAQRNRSGSVVRPLQSQAGRTNHNFSAGHAAWWHGSQFEFFAFWRHP